jgi:nucleoside-diphosphate-sugar epimerase
MDSLQGKRLVVFGCGYVGSAVLSSAVAAGMRVIALTRNHAMAGALRERGVTTVVADLATETWHTEIPGAPDFALNCVSSGGGGLEAYRRSYVEGMRSIAAWARARGPVGTLVYTSSTSVYPQSGGVRVDEACPAPGGTDRAELLAEAETLLRSATGVCSRWFVLRLAGIYGPERFHLLEQVRSGEVAGVGEHHLNLAHRDDIVAAVMSCYRAPGTVASEVFNVADDGAERKREVVAWLAERLGLPVPRFTGEPAGGRRAITPDRVIVNAKLKSTLGWQPRFSTFREGYASLLSR